MVEFQPSKLAAWVRFPSLAPESPFVRLDERLFFFGFGKNPSRGHEKTASKTAVFLCHYSSPTQILISHSPRFAKAKYGIIFAVNLVDLTVSEYSPSVSPRTAGK